MKWLAVSLIVDAETAEAVVEVLSRYVPQGVAVDQGDGGTSKMVTVRAYLEVDEFLEENKRKIEESLWHLGQISPIPEPEFSYIEDQDWTAAWKEKLQVLRLGKNIVVKPSWRDYVPVGDEVIIEMDPGRAFGTGLHPTTQLCVEALEELMEPGLRVLDLGTGTGVLALVAGKLGATEVLAVDLDSYAIVATRRNAKVNDLVQQIRPVQGSLAAVSGVYDVVMANILAPVIIKMSQEGLAARVRTGGVLVASGVLVEQKEMVSDALGRAGFQIVESRQIDDWVALIAKKLSPRLTATISK